MDFLLGCFFLCKFQYWVLSSFARCSYDDCRRSFTIINCILCENAIKRHRITVIFSCLLFSRHNFFSLAHHHRHHHHRRRSNMEMNGEKKQKHVNEDSPSRWYHSLFVVLLFHMYEPWRSEFRMSCERQTNKTNFESQELLHRHE